MKNQTTKEEKFLVAMKHARVKAIPSYITMAKENYTDLLGQYLKAGKALSKLHQHAENMLVALEHVQDGIEMKEQLAATKNRSTKPKKHAKK